MREPLEVSRTERDCDVEFSSSGVEDLRTSLQKSSKRLRFRNRNRVSHKEQKERKQFINLSDLISFPTLVSTDSNIRNNITLSSNNKSTNFPLRTKEIQISISTSQDGITRMKPVVVQEATPRSTITLTPYSPMNYLQALLNTSPFSSFKMLSAPFLQRSKRASPIYKPVALEIKASEPQALPIPVLAKKVKKIQPQPTPSSSKALITTRKSMLGALSRALEKYKLETATRIMNTVTSFFSGITKMFPSKNAKLGLYPMWHPNSSWNSKNLIQSSTSSTPLTSIKKIAKNTIQKTFSAITKIWRPKIALN